MLEFAGGDAHVKNIPDELMWGGITGPALTLPAVPGHPCSKDETRNPKSEIPRKLTIPKQKCPKGDTASAFEGWQF
jgi:hypothetical protein